MRVAAWSHGRDMTQPHTGSLHISSDTCPLAFVADLQYWGISCSQLATCCMKKYVDTKEQLDWEEAPQDEVVEEDFAQDAPHLQKFLWNLFEHPQSSVAARIIGIISVRQGSNMLEM